MKSIRYAALIGAVALVAGGLFILNSHAAQAADSNDSVGAKWRQRLKEELNLTSDQIAQIKAQLKSEKDNLASLLTRIHDARSQLRAEIQKPGATETSVRAAATQVAAVESDMAVERLKLYDKISPILTSDQRAKLSQMQAGLDQFVDRIIDRIKTKTSE
jgi:Spy/CpxP family protein refolding chaperone